VKDMAKESIFFYKDFGQYDIKLAEKYFRPTILEVFKNLYEEFTINDNWNNESIKSIIDRLTGKFDIKISKLAQPLRVAVTGTNISPSINDTLCLLGQEKSLDRLMRAIKYIENHYSY